MDLCVCVCVCVYLCVRECFGCGCVSISEWAGEVGRLWRHRRHIQAGRQATDCQAVQLGCVWSKISLEKIDFSHLPFYSA